MNDVAQHHCTLCGRKKDDDNKLLVGLHGAVCESCVSLAGDVFNTSRQARTSSKGRHTLDDLFQMTLDLADPSHGQVILGEGNTSAKDGETLWVKASGHQMPTITAQGFVQVRSEELVGFLDSPKPSDETIRAFLNASRVDPSSKAVPSTEALMHAWLLTLPGVNFVGHTHPINTLGIMCGPRAWEFAEHRYFPDQIVLCGHKSVFVPYVAPGFDLAVKIKEECTRFSSTTGRAPKTILLQNHGLIAVGATPSEVLSACFMMEKAAKVFLAANEPQPLTREQVEHIDGWTDEHFRQSQIWRP